MLRTTAVNAIVATEEDSAAATAARPSPGSAWAWAPMAAIVAVDKQMIPKMTSQESSAQ